MTKKIFRSIITVALTVLLASLVISIGFLYDYFNRLQINRLESELSLAATNVEAMETEWFNNYDSSVFRFTLVSPDGTVLYDTEVNSEEMENHLDRKEIKEALKNGKGSSARYSSTLTEKTLYESVLLQNGNILRISVNQLTVGALLIGMSPAVAAIILIAIVVSLILSDRMTKRIVKPLNELDLENPTENDTYEELSPILSKISRQREQIAEQLKLLRRRTDEFEQITASMSEGMVLLDKNGFIISMNPAAKSLFQIDGDPVSKDFLTVDRSPKMSNAVNAALGGRHSEFRSQKNGSEYQFGINRIESNGKTIGVVILCFDVTEAAFAERNRQEFTANVSHELKTPIQSIIGSAELLENGLVKAEDMSRFVGHIKNEAARLVSLIDDIIHLSELDETGEAPTEAVNLYAVASEVIEVLADSAAKKQVTLTLNGDTLFINGVRRYIYEIIYNLCDNAIRYNKECGNVTIDLSRNAAGTVLTVTDTGIGIPPEHQSRIFERFYRVDKSHSKETGGTGLGLSIVKHAVAYHSGKIELKSAPNKGTEIKITF